MSPAAPDVLPFDDLVDRLAGEASGVVTAVTPNRRLAQSLARAVARRHLAAGRGSWPAPDVLPWDDWLARLLEDATFDDRGPPPPSCLAPEAERLGWEAAIARDASRPWLVGGATLAREAQAAWRLAHDWGIAGALGSRECAEDAQAFAGWAAAWRQESARRGWTDVARLPSLVPSLLARPGVRRPSHLVAYGFHVLTPAQDDVLAACARTGIRVHGATAVRHEGRAGVLSCASPRGELALAARWARARLESAGPGRAPRLAVVVPDLAQRRDEVLRVFSRVLPPGSAAGAPLFNLSLGRPLAEYPLVDAALAVLDLAAGTMTFDRASRLLRSPFLAGGEAERDARARTDAALREIAPPLPGLADLRALLAEAGEAGGRHRVPPSPGLERLLAPLAATRPPGRNAPPHAWAAYFAACLAAVGFPGERALDSAEFQVLGKWHETLGRVGALGVVAERLTGEAARRHLRQACLDTVFQPGLDDAPVQVLGLLESAGLDFDALWVTGLTDDAWPQSPRPHPFLPVSLQRKAGIPQASAEASLDFDRRITQGWAGAAAEVVFSHASQDEDRALAPSPLLAPYPVLREESLGIPVFPWLGEALFEAGRAATAWDGQRDAVAPSASAATARGGTAILADQAACPFRAFARHRLRAEGLEAVEPGLGAADRGQLLHLLMARAWRALGDHATLAAMPSPDLEALVADAARVAVARLRAERPGRLEGRFAELERERLARAALAWLEIDRSREAFTVIAREEAQELQAGALRLRGRIDRVDRLASGGLAVIDYKSGTPRLSGWLGERPDDPQLPLYALAMADEVVAVAFACLRAGRLGFDGLARDDGLLPGVRGVGQHRTAGKLAGSWDELLEGWRRATARLAQDYLDGDARVDPKSAVTTCDACDLAVLCRVRERADPPGEEDAQGDEP